MATEGKDLKRRGRRFFGLGRRNDGVPEETAPEDPALGDPAPEDSAPAEAASDDAAPEDPAAPAEAASGETAGSAAEGVPDAARSVSTATPEEAADQVAPTPSPKLEPTPDPDPEPEMQPEVAAEASSSPLAANFDAPAVDEGVEAGTEPARDPDVAGDPAPLQAVDEESAIDRRSEGSDHSDEPPHESGQRSVELDEHSSVIDESAPVIELTADVGPSSESYELPRIVAIANQKGGVGKTTTAVNLGACLAEIGFRVLVVDLDPQGNASTGLGINARNLQGSIYDVIMNDAAVEDCTEPTSLKNLFLAPATIDLAGAEIELVPAFSRELKLRRALEDVRDEYDYVLIDCPPSLGLLTVNGLAAADDVIVPIQCEYYALEGLSQLIRNVNLVRNNLNPKLDVRGIVLTMYDARTKLADQVEREVRDHFGPKVYKTVVPRTIRLGEAPSFGQPIILFDATSRGAVAYRELAKEVSGGATRRSG